MQYKTRLESNKHNVWTRCHPERSEGPHRGCSIMPDGLCDPISDSGILRFAQDDRWCAMTLSRVIEALLFSAQKPLSIRELKEAVRGAGAEDEPSPNEFARVTEAEIAAALEQLKIKCIEQQSAFQLNEKANGWQLATDPKYAQWVR